MRAKGFGLLGFIGAMLTTSALAAEQRFIPVELWTGGEWSGKQDLTFSPADLTFGDGRKQITGFLRLPRMARHWGVFSIHAAMRLFPGALNFP